MSFVPPTDGYPTTTAAPVLSATYLGVLRSKYGSTRITRIFSPSTRLMISRVCEGEGGMPGLGSTWPATTSWKCFAKFGHESWKVTILLPAYGASFFRHSASLAV